MADTEGVILEILKQYQKKSGSISEIHRLTQELDRAMSTNDQGSVQLILEMRQDEMEQAAKCNETIAYLGEHLAEGQRQRLDWIIHGEEETQEELSWEEKKLWELSRQVELLLQKTIEIDKRLNQKVAGKDSFYSQEK